MSYIFLIQISAVKKNDPRSPKLKTNTIYGTVHEAECTAAELSCTMCGWLVHPVFFLAAEQVASSYRKTKSDYVWLESIVVLLLLQKKRGAVTNPLNEDAVIYHQMNSFPRGFPLHGLSWWDTDWRNTWVTLYIFLSA